MKTGVGTVFFVLEDDGPVSLEMLSSDTVRTVQPAAASANR